MIRFDDLRSCDALVRGLTLLGAGGGGAPEVGMNYLRSALDKGLRLAVVEPGGMGDECLTASVAGLGGRAPRTPPTPDELSVMGDVSRRSSLEECVVRAAAELQEHAGARFAALVPIELGGSNTPIAMLAAATLGIPIVDGDYAGRAVPELVQTTVGLKSGSPYPMAVVDHWGNVTLMLKGTGFGATDRIARHLCAAAYGPVGIALFVLPMGQARRFLVPGSVGASWKVGTAMQRAADGGQDPIAAVLSSGLGARLVFRGRVTEMERPDQAGYMFSLGQAHISGDADFAGRRLRIWFKNEFHVAWLDDAPCVTSPDVIAVIDRGSGWPLTHGQVEAGMAVAVVGIPCLEKWYRSPSGLELLGPRHFGFDIEYRPLI